MDNICCQDYAYTITNYHFTHNKGKQNLLLYQELTQLKKHMEQKCKLFIVHGQIQFLLTTYMDTNISQKAPLSKNSGWVVRQLWQNKCSNNSTNKYLSILIGY